MSLPFVIREAVPDDLLFIGNAWRASMLHASIAVLDADRTHYHSEMSRVLSRLLAHATVRVACDPKDESNLVGFAAMTGEELHYAYISGGFRKLGIVPMLLDGHKITCYTFQTRPGLRRLKPSERGWSFFPRFTID